MFVLLVTLAVAASVHPLAVAVLGRALGARVQELSLGLAGPVLVEEPRIRVGVFPGGYVLFEGAGEPDGAWSRLPSWRRSLIPLAGPAALFGLSSLLIGLEPALDAALRLPPQLLLVENRLLAVHAIEAGVTFLGEPPTTVFGTVAAKLAALNALPLPGLAGGDAIGAWLGLFSPLQGTARLLSAVLALFLLLCWADALVAWWSR